MTAPGDHQAVNAQDFSALLPGLAATLEDCAAHYRDTGDAEDVHSIRVATRRVRAALGLPSNAHRAGAEALADEAKWLGDAVSATRDADVLLETVENMAGRRDSNFPDEAKPLRQALVNSANLARGAAKRSLGSKRLGKFVQDLRDFQKAATGDPGGAVEDTQPGISPFRQLALDHRRLRRRTKKALASGRQEDFHRMRIAAKKVRYSMEVISNDQANSAASGPLAGLRKLQDLLGEAHDLHVAADRVAELADRNLEKWERPTLKTASVLRRDLLARADRLHGRVPARYGRVSGKRWKRSVRKLKKSV